MSSCTHWPKSSGKECWCGDTFENTEAFREHLRVWAEGMQTIRFTKHTSHWVSITITPNHTFTAQADPLNPYQYVIDCQCGWVERATLPLSRHTQNDTSPGRLALEHIREVVAERLKLEEAME